MSLDVRRRNCDKEKNILSSPYGMKKICIPIGIEEYGRILYKAKLFKDYINSMVIKYPEIFPSNMDQNYKLHDIFPESKKMKDLRLRRIKYEGEVFTIAPFFVLPYMMGYSDDVEKPLFLRRFGVTYWALTYVFGYNDMYWYRIENRIGRNSVVGTTVKHSYSKSRNSSLVNPAFHGMFCFWLAPRRHLNIPK